LGAGQVRHPAAKVEGAQQFSMPPEQAWRVQPAVITAMAIGFAGAGIGCGALAVCAAVDVLP
jgi:hypothetical protein